MGSKTVVTHQKMQMHSTAMFLIVCFLIIHQLATPLHAVTDENDVEALLAIQQTWSASQILHWSGSDPCGSKWMGIGCNNASSSPQRVTSLILSGLGLSGYIPSDIQFLTALETLDLSYNKLSGQLPSHLSELQNLTDLILQSNQFTGSIPSEFGKMRSLKFLYLNSNFLSGKLPNELGYLSNLYWLDVAYNQLSGNLPYSSDGSSLSNVGLDNLTQAKHFHLNNNQFSGSIPNAMCHSSMSLVHLLLDSNNLEDRIPEEMGLCSSLEILRISNNSLVGDIPDQLSQLTNLTELHASQNQLNGDIANLTNLTNLAILDLSNNDFDIDFPPWLPYLKRLTDLLMAHLKVSGKIPAPLFALPALTTVKLANNGIIGPLDMSEATTQLTLVSLENNKIAGIPMTGKVTVKDLRMNGNPACESGVLSQKVCGSSPSVLPVASYGNMQCPTTCSDQNYQPSPLQCACELPYTGSLIFRAPMFTAFTNTSLLEKLAQEIATNLNIPESQIVIPSAQFNDLSQLSVKIEIFPNRPSGKWSAEDVIHFSYTLGRIGIHLKEFGPPMFLQDHVYDYGIHGSGLSTGMKVGIGIGAGCLAFVIIAILAFALSQKRRADKIVERNNQFGGSRKDGSTTLELKGARLFLYAELRKATHNFCEANEIGSGSYGKVYRGITSTGQQVAIKRAAKNSIEGRLEFKTEIELLSRVHHRNVVSLIGFCFEYGEQMLVYEYMAGGSLRDNLLGHTRIQLDWKRRLMIALGAARGITYLHELANPPIIHRDIKSTNILLDEKKVAKVSDFGLSKIGLTEGDGRTHISTQVKGTMGYLDPEYYTSQQLTEKSDVYSYGVVMFELLTCRAPIEHGKYIVKEIKEAVDKFGLSAVHSFLDPRLKVEQLEELNSYVRIALACVNDSASARPSMSEVVKHLEDLVGHDYPESGSSNIDVLPRPRRLYSSGSDNGHTSRESSESSFANSVGPRW